MSTYFVRIARGRKGFPAVLIEGFEKLQALKPQVVDIAAQEVQREVQRVANIEISTKVTTLPVMPPRVLKTLAMMLPESIKAMSRA